jgi:nucleotide-binding universal stress UspA family protein
MSPSAPTNAFRLTNILVATDFSLASKMALLYAIAIARRHTAKLYIAHVTSSESALMEGWRSGQAEVMEHFMAGRLDGIENQLVVRAGEIWTVISSLVAEFHIDLILVGTRGRTGVWKILLGSVAERIFQRSPCPVLTVGPNVSGQNPDAPPARILVPTGFAAQSVYAVKYAVWLAQELRSHLAVLHVVTDAPKPAAEEHRKITDERLARLRALIPSDTHLASLPEFFVTFGDATGQILETADTWNANLLVLGLHQIRETTRTESTWAKAHEIVSSTSCPVLTVRAPEPAPA